MSVLNLLFLIFLGVPSIIRQSVDLEGATVASVATSGAGIAVHLAETAWLPSLTRPARRADPAYRLFSFRDVSGSHSSIRTPLGAFIVLFNDIIIYRLNQR